MVATRREWPDVVGSRDSIAITDASTKPSNITRISSYEQRVLERDAGHRDPRERQLLGALVEGDDVAVVALERAARVLRAC